MIEAIIASGILVTAIGSSLTLVTAAVNAEKASEGGIISSNLAREGIEVVRAIRDANWLADRTWDDGLEGPGGDYVGVPVFSPATNSWTMKFDSVAGFADAATAMYRYSTVAPGGKETVGLFVQAAAQPANTMLTPFRRFIELDPICSDDLDGYRTSGACAAGKAGIRALVQVQWSQGGKIRTVMAEERLYDWR